jgi:hypothetical protein
MMRLVAGFALASQPERAMLVAAAAHRSGRSKGRRRTKAAGAGLVTR